MKYATNDVNIMVSMARVRETRAMIGFKGFVTHLHVCVFSQNASVARKR